MRGLGNTVLPWIGSGSTTPTTPTPMPSAASGASYATVPGWYRSYFYPPIEPEEYEHFPSDDAGVYTQQVAPSGLTGRFWFGVSVGLVAALLLGRRK
jgi:hypothetical protein